MLAIETWARDTSSKVGASTGGGAKKGIMGAGNAYHRKVFRALELHFRIANLDATLHVEPWLRSKPSYRLCQPDAVVLGDDWAVVVEVKKNWKDGRDEKLLNLYLPAVKSAFGVSAVYPLMICGCVRGLSYPASTTFQDLITRPKQWQPGDPTPVILSL